MAANAPLYEEILGCLIPRTFLEQFQILKGFIVDVLNKQKLKEKLKHFFEMILNKSLLV